MALDVVSTIVIRLPVREVYRYAANPDNAVKWYRNIKSVEWRSGRPIGVGTRIAFMARFLGRDLAYTYEITELIPEKKIVMKTAGGPFPMETTYTWKAVAGGATRMSLRNAGYPTGFSRWIAPLVGMAVRASSRKDLAQLKSLLERPNAC